MNQHRFFISPDRIQGQHVTLIEGQARQIYSVLRMREGQHIDVLDNEGWRYEVLLEKVSSDLVIGSITRRNRAEGEPHTHLTLYQAMLKKDNFEWVLQKGTEIGVSRFVPLITERCVVRQKELKRSKVQRWQRIISEAAEQSGRAHLPLLSAPINLGEALGSAGDFDGSLISWERETENDFMGTLRNVVEQRPQGMARIALYIGPEGGFSEDEIEDAGKAGVLPVTLGSRILRAETAAIVASTLTLSLMGDL